MSYRYLPFALLLAPMAPAFGVQEFAKMLTADGEAYDGFGGDVAIDGNIAILSASGDDDNGSGAGAAYLFDATTGLELMKLISLDGEFVDVFGHALGISGNTALIGAPHDDDFGSASGSAYLFDVTTGQQIAKLLPADGAASDFFGTAAAIHGNVALLGANRDDDNGNKSGSAYLFDVTTGQELFKLLPNDGLADDYFGTFVALHGNVAVVSSWLADDLGDASGKVYLFDAQTGLQTAVLLPDDGHAGARFGSEVAVHGNTVVVSSIFDDDNGVDSGSAYLFNATTGEQIAKLLPSDGAPSDMFGYSVGINGSFAIIGAARSDHSGLDSGAAYLFDIQTGLELGKLLPSDGLPEDLFGNSVALSDDAAVVGARWCDDNGQSAGAGYLFHLPDLLGTSYCGPSVPNSSGAPGVIRAVGSDQVIDDSLQLLASDLPPNQFGYFLVSATQALVQNPGGSQGDLCLGGEIGRFNAQVGNSGSVGGLGIQVDISALPMPSGPVQVLPGETWNFTAWYRDTNPGTTSNFTDAVSVQFQ